MGKNMDITVAGRIDALNEKERRYRFNGKEFKRGNSWEYCHKAFLDCAGKPVNKIDYDYLALHLAFYLASWGMYRGSSFLLELDYRVHIPAVEMMMSEKYRPLFTIENPFANTETKKTYKNLMFGTDGIYKKLEAYYLAAHQSIAQQRREDDEKRPNKKSERAKHDPTQESDTLLTKILLGVYGCIPAYDRYFKDGIGFFGKQKSLNAEGKAVCGEKKSLRTLLTDCTLKEELDGYWQEHKDEYTYMKVVDMYFFSLGTLLEDGVKKAELEERIRQHYSIK